MGGGGEAGAAAIPSELGMGGTLRPILAPASVAVVGASRTRGTIGHEIVASLLLLAATAPCRPTD